MVLGWYSKEDEMRNGNGKGSGKLNGGFLYVWKSEELFLFVYVARQRKFIFLFFATENFSHGRV